MGTGGLQGLVIEGSSDSRCREMLDLPDLTSLWGVGVTNHGKEKAVVKGRSSVHREQPWGPPLKEWGLRMAGGRMLQDKIQDDQLHLNFK